MIKKLFILLLFVLLIPIFGCGSTKSNPTPTLYIKLGFVNASGLVASRIHVVIDGYNSAGQWGYYDLSQDPAVFSVTSDMSSVPDTTLDALIAHGAITIPYIVSGRVYLGLDQRVSAEAADFTTPNSPSGIIYDKFELSVAPTGNVINLTQVDYFNFPLKITCTSEVRGFNDGITRKNVFDEYLAAMSNGWEKLALTDNLGNRLRILNPAKIAPADAAYFSQLYSYWDALINVYWATGKTLTILTDDLPNR
ncbi:MAG: beta-1,3-glucanase family protein, partial [Candidatus Margulisiibacteriota bacterium]